MTFTPDQLRRDLLAWYDATRRDLPWRASADPYRVWVSEIMLQQTRVDAVVPYYQRWLEAFPDVEALAQAELHDVLKQWEGLGYYTRARNLHSAAAIVRERYNGNLPAEYDELRKLPGIGEYTAGAIASIVYNQARPAVDGNVRRVLSRLYDVARPAPATVRRLAGEIIDPERPGDFNQALMELGATVCTPRAPSCETCPLRELCQSRANGTVAARPGAKTKKPIPHEYVNTLVLLHDGCVLLAQRPQKGLLGGLWEFATAENPQGAEQLGAVTHVFSHKRVTYRVFFEVAHREAAVNQRWVPLAELTSYALPAAQRRIEALVKLRRSAASSRPAASAAAHGHSVPPPSA